MFFSPSGCTFWGKKPWSRKKKILWQLGLLIGAPLGIALVAGVAVPAIIIGMPVWIGKKVCLGYFCAFYKCLIIPLISCLNGESSYDVKASCDIKV